jgi:hypothetical protein
MDLVAVTESRGGGNDHAVVVVVVDRLRLLVKDHQNVGMPKMTDGSPSSCVKGRVTAGMYE